MLQALMAELSADVKAKAFTSGEWHMLSNSAIASSARPLLIAINITNTIIITPSTPPT